MAIYTTNVSTAGHLVRELANMLLDLQHPGVTTGNGSTTTWVDTSQPETANDDERVIGDWILALEGAAAGQERVSVATYTGSTGTGTFQRAGTALGNGVAYIRTRKYQPTRLLNAIQRAQSYQAQRLIAGLPIIGREIVLGSAIPNNVDLFTTANVPDGLTLDSNSTFTSQTTVTLGGRKVLRMVTDGTNAGFIRYAIPQWGRFAKGGMKLYAQVRTSAPLRTTTLINDGVTSTTYSFTKTSTFELAPTSQSLTDASTQARVSVEVSAGTAVTVELAYWYAPDPMARQMQYPLDADRGIVAIGNLRISSGSVADTHPDAHTFPMAVPYGSARIVEDSEDTPRKLVVNVGSQYDGHVLQYWALQRHPEITAVTTAYSGVPELILARAKYNITGDPDDLRAALEVEKPKRLGGLAVDLPDGLIRVQSS